MNEQINEQLGLLEKELARLKNVTDYIDETKENAKEVIESLDSVQKNFSIYTEKIYNVYTNSIDQIRKETDLNIKEGVLSFETTGNRIDQTNREKLVETKKLLENYRKTVEAADNLVKTIESVDFPMRLDSIERSIKVNRILIIISIVIGVGAILLRFLI